jgi:iron complex outermembrane receptor protein
MSSSKLRYVLVATSALGLLQAAPAFAQSRSSDIGEVVVTARRVQERLQDVPISITVFNQEQLTSRNIVTAADLATYTPSLSVTNVLGFQSTAFSLRGFVQETGTEPSVGVYFADVIALRGASNGQPAGNGAGPGAFFDLQNVQVLKGPQGTLFGRNTTGGSVLLVPQKPTDNFEGYVEGSVGNYDLRRVQAVVNVPLGDKARFRFGVDRNKRDGYVKNLTNIGPRDFNDVDYTAMRASLVVDLTPSLENYTILSSTESKTNGDMMRLFQANVPDFIGSFAAGQLARFPNAGFFTTQNSYPNAHVTTRSWQIINTTTWQANENLEVKNIASYGELRYNLLNSFFGDNFLLGDVFPGSPPGTIIHFSGNVSFPGGNTANQMTFTEEFRASGRAFDGALDWQGGVYYERSHPLGVAGSLSNNVADCPGATLICAVPIPSATPGIGGGGSQTSVGWNYFRNTGVYAQGTYSLTDRLKLTAGARYSWSTVNATRSLKGYFYPFGFTPTQPLGYTCTVGTFPDCIDSRTQKSKAPTWVVDFDYKLTDDTLIYGKWSRGFRAGAVSPPGPSESFATFKPEKVDTYEVGLKTGLPGRLRGYANFAAFYNNFQDQQLQVVFAPLVAGLPSSAGVVNAGKSRIFGLEFDGSVSPFEGFTVSGGYAYLNTKIKQIELPAATGSALYRLVSSQRVGDRLAYAPKHKFTVTGSYDLPLDDKIGLVTLSATYTYTGNQLTSYTRRDANGEVFDSSLLASRQLLDVNLTWKGVGGSPIDVGLFANNVTNKKYFNMVLDLPAGAGGLRSGQLGLPRMYGVRMRYRFGQ